MIKNKSINTLQIISEEFKRNKIPFCLIGAMALGLYGMPRFTADLDLLSEQNCATEVLEVMEELGYTCFQKSSLFAQFDTDLSGLPNVDLMFVSTEDGKEIIKRSAIIKNEIYSALPVIQPTDYIILKLMAIANNPERSIKDEADIAAFFNLIDKNLISDKFETLDKNKIMIFADKFEKRSTIEKYFTENKKYSAGNFCI